MICKFIDQIASIFSISCLGPRLRARLKRILWQSENDSTDKWNADACYKCLLSLKVYFWWTISLISYTLISSIGVLFWKNLISWGGIGTFSATTILITVLFFFLDSFSLIAFGIVLIGRGAVSFDSSKSFFYFFVNFWLSFWLVWMLIWFSFESAVPNPPVEFWSDETVL